MDKNVKPIVIPYKPREWALEFHNSDNRYRILVCHRRAGKTVALANELIKVACITTNGRVAYIAPTYRQAKRVAWDFFKHYSAPIPGVSFNESELRMDYPNGSRLSLYGADNPDSLRGISLDMVGFDEYSQQPASIWGEIVRPALADRQGKAIWIGTPKGKNSFYDLLEYGQKNGWYTKILRASESGILPQQELLDARKEMTQDEYDQEFECSFTASVKGAYYRVELSEAREAGRIGKILYDRSLPVHTFWDLGIGDSTAIVFAQIVNMEIRIIDYYEQNGVALEEHVRVLKERDYLYESHWLPHDVQVKELTTGKSRFEVLAQLLGINSLKMVPNLSIKDGIDAARRMFNRMWFDETNSEQLLDSLGSYQQVWDDKMGMFRDRPLHNWASHAADAFRYMAISVDLLTKRVERSGGIPSKYNSIGKSGPHALRTQKKLLAKYKS